VGRRHYEKAYGKLSGGSQITQNLEEFCKRYFEDRLCERIFWIHAALLDVVNMGFFDM